MFNFNENHEIKEQKPSTETKILLEKKEKAYKELKDIQENAANTVKTNEHQEKTINLAKNILKYTKLTEGDKHYPKKGKKSGFKKSLKNKLYKKTKGCVACGGGTMGYPTQTHPPIELHHIIPRLYEGGDNSSSNALIVCRDCHVKIHS